MSRRYKVDDGGAVAFRKTPAMADRSDVHAKPGDVILPEARSGSGEDEWVRHTNGLWLPVKFLLAEEDADGLTEAQGKIDGAAARANVRAGATGSPPVAVVGGAAGKAPSAVDDAKNAQRERLERLPSAPSPQTRPIVRPHVGLKLELDPGAALPSEPHLKYLRLGGKVADSLRRSDLSKAECATDLDANEKLLALATQRGTVHVLDLSGGSIRRFDAHSMPVHAVHIDHDGEHIASCSNEGRTVIHELYGHETQTFEYGEALTCVRLAPGYAKQNEFVVGSFDGHVRLKNKNWFGQMKDEDVHADEGKIEEIAWQLDGAFLAWASGAGVKVWDCRQRQMVGHVPSPSNLEGESQRCSLCWADERTLLIGWGQEVSVIEIRDREVTPVRGVRRTDSSGLPNYMVTVAAKIELEQAVCCGVAPFDGALMVLCVPTHDATPDPVPGDEPSTSTEIESIESLPEYVSIARGMVREGFAMDSKPVGALEKGESVHALEVRINDSGIKRVRFARGWTSESSKNGQMILREISAAQAQAGARRPQLRILTTAGLPLLVDVLDVREFRRARPRDYRLRYTPSVDDDLEMFFIMAPHDILVVKRRDAADHVDFLLHRGDTEDALRVAQTKFATGEIGRALLLQISHRWIEQLFSAAKYAEAASQCSQLLGADIRGWERWIYAFAERRRLREIAPGFCEMQSRFKQTSQDAKFSPPVYEMVLHLYVDSKASGDHATLYKLLQRWPTEWYDSANIITAVQEKLKAVGAFGDFATSADQHSAGESPDMQTETMENQVGLADCLALLLTQRGEHLRSLELRLALGLALKRRTVKGSRAPTTYVQKRIESRAKRVFDYIDGHGLHMFLCPLIRPLIELHSDRALRFFVQHSNQIPISDVASQLQTGREIDVTQLHTYLHKVFTRDPHGIDGKEYHTSHVEWLAQRAANAASVSKGSCDKQDLNEDAEGGPLTADSEGSRGSSEEEPTGNEAALLKFLKNSPHYEVEHSLEICQTKRLHRCSIYLLGRMGRSREALDVIFDELHDMSAAIAFLKSRTDEPRLWTLLLERALAEPAERAGEYVGQLLTSAGQSVDPLMLIDRIPEGLEIPRMRDKLVAILRDYSFATRMHAGCVQVAERDNLALAMEAVRARRRAARYRPSGHNDDGQLTAELIKKQDTLRGTSAVRAKRRAVGVVDNKDVQERAHARRKRLEAARMSRSEFAEKYLQPNQQQGTGTLMDYRPLASRQAERSRICQLTGLNGHLEASGITLPTVQSSSMSELSEAAANLINASDDESTLDGFGMSTEAAAIAGLEIPALQGKSRRHDGSNEGLSSRLRPSGDSTEDLQRRVATAIASAETAMTMTMASPTVLTAASALALPSPTSAGWPTSDVEDTSPRSSGSPAIGLHTYAQGIDLEEEQDDMKAGDSVEPSISLASILGDTFSNGVSSGLPPDAQMQEEPISLVDTQSGSEIHVEGIGVNAEDVMAIIDNA